MSVGIKIDRWFGERRYDREHNEFLLVKVDGVEIFY